MQGIIKSKGRLLSILVISMLCSKKFYGILSCISKNVIELNARKRSLRAILNIREESGGLEMAMWFLPSRHPPLFPGGQC